MTPSSDLYTSTVQSGPFLLMLHSRSTFVFKLLIPRRPILYLLPLPPHHRPLLLAVLVRLLPPLPRDSIRVIQSNAGGIRARSTDLLHFLSSHPIDRICIQKSNFNSSSSFRISGFSALHSDRTHSRSGILSRDATHTSGGVIIFVRQGLFFSELSTSSLSSLHPYSEYVGVNISHNNSSSVSFLNVYAPPYSLLSNGWQNRLLFSLHFSLLKKSLYSGEFQLLITPSETQEVLPTRAGRRYSTGSSLLTSSPSMTLTHPPFSIAPLAVAPLLTFPLLPSTLALSCSWEVLQDLGSDHLPILLSIPLSPVFRPNERASSFNFQKARWVDFVSYFDSHCSSAEKYSSLSSAAALFTSLALNAAKSSISFRPHQTPS